MCLQTLYQRKTNACRVGWQVKRRIVRGGKERYVALHQNHTMNTPVYGGVPVISLAPGVWYRGNNGWACAIHSRGCGEYIAGFHIWNKKEDAIEAFKSLKKDRWKNIVLVKVEVKEIQAVGRNFKSIGKTGLCTVARKMRITYVYKRMPK